MASQDLPGQLAATVLDNLRHQHDWTNLQLHTRSPITQKPLPRPLISGMPPRRLYLHPDDQIELLKAHKNPDEAIPETPELEWVLPTHLAEKWSLRSFAGVFDSMPPHNTTAADRHKRLLMATIHDDSTVVYYLMHDGIVKPRQN